MKITIESTEQITELDGVKARVWHGVTESGNKCFVFVHRIAVGSDQNQSEFDKELSEQIPPWNGKVIPLSQII